jgi:hypothetical protein
MMQLRDGRMVLLKKWAWIVGFLLVFAASTLLLPSFVPGEEYTFEISEIEKKSYHLGGYAEINRIFWAWTGTRAFTS